MRRRCGRSSNAATGSRAGARASLVGARALGWDEDAWLGDPALTDGGLQLAVLWAEQELGGATLPMGVGEYRLLKTGLADGPVQCLVQVRGVRQARAECDVVFLDADGSVRAELLAVDLVLRPDNPA